MKNAVRQLFFTVTASVLLCPALPAQTTDAKAMLLPGREYSIVIKRSYGGNDGFSEVIPQVSEQLVRIVTGETGKAGMPATLFVDRPRRIEEKSGLLSEARREWEIRFMVTAAGTVADISGLSSDDGPVPDALAASVLTSQLDALLFITDYPLERKGKPVVAVTSVAENEKGFVEIAYTLRDEGGLEQLPVGAEGAVMTARGSASYSAADRFFTRRTHEATTTMHIMQAATGDEKTVTMTEKTAYEATIKSM